MIPGGSMIARHRVGVDWKDMPFDDLYAGVPATLGHGSIYDVVVFDLEDPLAPIKDIDACDPSDVFIHLMRMGFRDDADLFIALQQFSRIEGETWAVILRDAMAEQLAAEDKTT